MGNLSKQVLTAIMAAALASAGAFSNKQNGVGPERSAAPKVADRTTSGKVSAR